MDTKYQKKETEQSGYQSWHNLIAKSAAKYPGKVFIESLDQGTRITFREMHQWVGRVANFFKSKNLTKNDRVTLIGQNSLETMILYFGTLNYGAILNPIFSGESPENICRIVDMAKPTMILHDRDLNLESLRRKESEWIPFSDWTGRNKHPDDLFRRIDTLDFEFEDHCGTSEDVAEILYTSGTTSIPKGILLTRKAMFLMVQEISERIGLTDTDKILEYRAYNWASAQLLSILSSMMIGNTLFLGKKFSRSKFPDWLKRHDITVSAGVPAVFSMMINEPVSVKREQVPHLRFITSSSAPLTKEIHLQFEAMYGIPINQMMGMSEAGWMAGNPPEARKIGSVGLPLKHKKIVFLNDENERCKPGQIGEMVVSGDSMGWCYYNEDGIRTEFPKEGFRTGDLGYMDEEGYIFITGRKKDLIIRGGINISPMEISSRLLDHAAVAEAATIGVPDQIFGEEVVSIVALKNGALVTPQELISHCQKSLPDFKVPKKIIFVVSLPKNERGKVSRDKLFQLLDQK